MENNPPEIHDYWINDVALTEPFSINYGEDLVFTFNISDVENSITYVTVSLLDEDGNWFNITREYKNNFAQALIESRTSQKPACVDLWAQGGMSDVHTGSQPRGTQALGVREVLDLVGGMLYLRRYPPWSNRPGRGGSIRCYGDLSGVHPHRRMSVLHDVSHYGQD